MLLLGSLLSKTTRLYRKCKNFVFDDPLRNSSSSDRVVVNSDDNEWVEREGVVEVGSLLLYW